MLSVRLPALALASALLIAPRLGGASECEKRPGLSTCIDSDNLWARPGGGSFFSIGATTTTPEDQVAFGLVGSYLSRPIAVRVASADPDGTVVYLVDNAIDVSLLWAVGITDRLELTLAAPITLYQDGAGIGDIIGSGDALPRSAVRDTRFGLTFALLPRPRTGAAAGLAVTSRLEFGIPIGDGDAFAGAESLVAVPTVTGDYRWRRFTFGLDIGARVRTTSELAGAKVGSQLSGALGATFDLLSRDRLTLGAEAFALYTLASQPPPTRDSGKYDKGPALVPAEWLVSASTAPLLGGDVRFAVGGGSSIPLATEAAITAPRFRFDLSVRYAPSGHDTDGDGVRDRDDRCPTEPEDRDGFEDEDGCPDPDNDRDGIPDAKDRCRDAAETVDGFQDADGCPDQDDDGDGIPDDRDKCRNAPEDKDGFQDADGCPDPDNDGDGILDADDRCPNAPEDKDGYQDEDGCPDPDNDQDGVLDANDKCPSEPEDRDGFRDEDGCPDPDNDEDGVLDADDKCPTVAETIDGVADGDGCPEPGAKSLVDLSGNRVVFTSALTRFAAGSATVTQPMEKQLKIISQRVRGRAPFETVIVEAYPDRAGETGARAQELASRRASAIKAILSRAGIPADRVTAVVGDAPRGGPAAAVPFEVTIVPRAPSSPLRSPSNPIPKGP